MTRPSRYSAPPGIATRVSTVEDAMAKSTQKDLPTKKNPRGGRKAGGYQQDY